MSFNTNDTYFDYFKHSSAPFRTLVFRNLFDQYSITSNFFSYFELHLLYSVLKSPTTASKNLFPFLLYASFCLSPCKPQTICLFFFLPNSMNGWFNHFNKFYLSVKVYYFHKKKLPLTSSCKRKQNVYPTIWCNT